jgi:hypothetical protein
MSVKEIKKHSFIKAKKLIQAIHPPINSNENPPEYTVTIEADIATSVA